MTVKPFSKQNFATRNYNVINAVPVATYSLSSLAASYNEGDTITITITTTGIVDGTVLYWTTTGTTSGADFSDGVVSGSVTITNNSGTVTRTVLADLTTEGTETFVFNLLTGSTSGTIVASTSSANILDTSTSPLNYSVNFNGSSQYLVLPLNSGFAIGTGDFTVEAWVYPRALQYWGTIIAGANYGSGSDWGFYTGDGTSRYPFFQMTNNGADTILATSFIPLNTWSHLAVTRSSGTVRIFINGILSNSGTFATQSLDNSYQKGIGGCYNGNGNTLLNGYISNLRVVKGTAVYTAAFTPPTTALTAITNTSLLTCKGGTIADASTNALTITNTGTALVSGENPFGNYSMSFNGSSQYLTVPQNTAFAFDTGDFTIEAWIYTTSSATQRIVSINNTTEFLLVNTGSNVYLNFFDGTVDNNTGSNYVPQNQWVHIAVSRAGTSLKLFINGVLSGTTTNSANLVSAGVVYIGRWAGGASNYFAGYISNLRVVKGTAVYTAAFTPPTVPLSAITNTSLLTCQYAELFDASTNHFTITNNNTAPAITANPFDNYAYAFNGSQYFTAASSTAVTFGTGDFTIEFWFFATNTGGRQDIYGSDNGSDRISIWLQGNTVQYYRAGTNITSGTFTTNTWVHCALVRSSGVSKIYLNGTQSGSSYTDTYNFTLSQGLKIGADVGGGPTPFYGYVTNLRVVKGTAVYTSTFTPSTSPLTAITGTSLLTCQYAELFDASTNNIALTNGATTAASPAVATNLFAAPNNLKNYSAKFNGSNILNVPQNAAFSFGTGDFTFEYWYYALAYGQQNLVDFRGSSGSGEFSTYLNSSDNTLKFNDGASDLFSTAIVLNTWTHVALSRNSNVFRAYVNGTQLGANTSTATNYTNSSGLNIGAYRTSLAYFNGYISNLRVVKGIGMYTANFTPSATPLLPVANTVLLTLQSNRIYDAGPNQFSITNTGSTKMAYLSPFST